MEERYTFPEIEDIDPQDPVNFPGD